MARAQADPGHRTLCQYWTSRRGRTTWQAFGETALHWAGKRGDAPTARTLVGAKADVSAEDDSGAAAHQWARANHTELLAILKPAQAAGRGCE
eukprot:999794-Rhodomonas_salina.1